VTAARSRPRVLLSHAAYDLLALLACAALLPAWLWRASRDAEQRRWLRERLGRLPDGAPQDGPVWVHAVSVGEVKAARPLLAELSARHPAPPLVLSTATLTGYATARALYPGLYVFQAPVDLRRVVTRVLRRLRPRALLLVELEAWPALLRAADEGGVPVAIVNGRITERSFRRYLAWRWWLPEFHRLALVAAQDSRCAERLVQLGVEAGRVHVTGNLKHDRAAPVPAESVAALAGELGLVPGTPVLVAGSTHAGEEEAVVEAWRAAGGQASGEPACRLVLVPRHPERAPEVLRMLARARVAAVVRSAPGAAAADPRAVIVADRMGELEALFGCATVAFLGGSLAPVGGHNVLEPALAGLPVLVGPHLDSCRAEAELLAAAGGLRIVADAAELAARLAELLRDEPARRAMGQRARAAAAGLSGAAAADVRLLAEAGLLSAR
jgi:3-deoxy-D-manno-octulosonic-acid transferase